MIRFFLGYITFAVAALYLNSTALHAKTIEGAEAALSAKGNASKGKRIFNNCLSCHAVEDGGLTRVGPHLKEIIGREVGTVEGYRYSSALKTASFVWSEEMLDKWLAEPRTFLPGNRMTFTGLEKEQERNDLLAYLKLVSTSQ